MFSTLGKIVACRKKVNLMKNRISFSILENRKCPRYLPEVTLSALVQFTLPAGFRYDQSKHTKVVFVFLLRLFLCFSLILFLVLL